jgi:hypothetical protein
MMKIISSLVLVFTIGLCPSFGQNIQATTTDGRKVILKNDGSWEFAKQPVQIKNDKIRFYEKPEKSAGQFPLRGGKIQIWYNQEIWKQKEIENPNRITFEHKDGDVYGLVIFERVPMELSALKEYGGPHRQYSFS